jgi:predicted O-methyltransferase YrrM
MKFTALNDRLYHYLRSMSHPEPDVLVQLREATAQMPQARMQISPDQGALMALLVQLMGARKTLEIGVFTGYSTLWVALALPPEGRIIACDISHKFGEMARRYWQLAAVDHKIDLRIAPALQTLDKLLAEGAGQSFDFAFIDADKGNYDAYYERSLELLRPGGLIAIDNVLWSGRVADAGAHDAQTVAIRAFNAKLQQDERICLSIVPIADGVTLALKRE